MTQETKMISAFIYCSNPKKCNKNVSGKSNLKTPHPYKFSEITYGINF